MNSLGEDQIGMMYAGPEETEEFRRHDHRESRGKLQRRREFDACLLAAQEGEWDDLARGIHRFQQVNLAQVCAQTSSSAPLRGRWAAVAKSRSTLLASRHLRRQASDSWKWARA